jgi:hypothetical protein
MKNNNGIFLIFLFVVTALVCLFIFTSNQNKPPPPPPNAEVKAQVKAQVNDALRGADPTSTKAYCDCSKKLANTPNCLAAKGTFAHDILCVNDIVSCCSSQSNTDGVACQLLGNTFAKC